MRETILWFDGLITFLVGLFFVVYPTYWLEFFGLPQTPDRFYPNLLGGLLVGIGSR